MKINVELGIDVQQAVVGDFEQRRAAQLKSCLTRANVARVGLRRAARTVLPVWHGV